MHNVWVLLFLGIRCRCSGFFLWHTLHFRTATTVIYLTNCEREKVQNLEYLSGCPLIKSGSLSRTERICKYNRLMLIEDQLNEK
ncbi:MAG: hypothetical protein GW815_00680 [Candidatus Moranbacteria bacterium]|nr:hypothetical protein [Candidatus Moranbacteria bacterium]HCJ45760.1 hypothetical protein [Candidatus Moranbacteria bacterium]